MLPVSIALLSFFASYFAYRNLKSVVPLLRPEELFDDNLENVDRTLFAGHDPGVLLHDLLGTGAAAHVMSFVYLLFFVFIPVSLAMTLVFSSDLRAGLFYSTAFSVNWLLGAASYFILPSMGPFEATPGVSRACRRRGQPTADDAPRRPRRLRARPRGGGRRAGHRRVRLAARVGLRDGRAGDAPARLRAPRKAGLWLLVGLTVASTVYLGWHYVVDDLGGVAIAALALALARVITGFDVGAARRMRKAPVPS